MNDDEFRWDNAKAAANYAKHGVTFDAARDVFKDTILGMAQDQLLFAVYTMRGDNVRIISARAAEPYEEREHHEQNTRKDQT